jgi:hypothetical protein
LTIASAIKITDDKYTTDDDNLRFYTAQAGTLSEKMQIDEGRFYTIT